MLHSKMIHTALFVLTVSPCVWASIEFSFTAHNQEPGTPTGWPERTFKCVAKGDGTMELHFADSRNLAGYKLNLAGVKVMEQNEDAPVCIAIIIPALNMQEMGEDHGHTMLLMFPGKSISEGKATRDKYLKLLSEAIAS